MTMTGATPWIGMPAQMDPDDDKQYLSRLYSDAVEVVGGIPLIIPLINTEHSIRSIAEKVDGILLTGSHSDLDPSRYGAQRSNACGPAQPLRDRMDFVLLETAIRREIPVLAICFGIQSLNVFLGGSLIQDIRAAMDTPVRHSGSQSGDFSSHPIKIASGSVLEQIAGGRDAVVNSTHHQAIERPGHDLDVIARAPDGVIESVSYASRTHWMLGVQWHPEKSFACDGFSRKLFENFLARCRAARGIDEGTHT